MTEISNNDVYLERMRAGLYDKCFWIDKIDPDITTIIDFGCACGDLFRFIDEIRPNKFKFIGIENNKTFMANAYSRATYYSDIKDVSCDWEHSVFVMNSVIHEIYSYCGKDTFKEILSFVFSKKIRHLAIRDMYYDNWADKETQLKWDIEVSRIACSKYPKEWADHLRTFNVQETIASLITTEFVLKYQYKENWDRECAERYFHPEMLLDLEMVALCKSYAYSYKEHFRIPQQAAQIAKDFTPMPTDLTTHVKLLLSRGKI